MLAVAVIPHFDEIDHVLLGLCPAVVELAIEPFIGLIDLAEMINRKNANGSSTRNVADTMQLPRVCAGIGMVME